MLADTQRAPHDDSPARVQAAVAVLRGRDMVQRAEPRQPRRLERSVLHLCVLEGHLFVCGRAPRGHWMVVVEGALALSGAVAMWWLPSNARPSRHVRASQPFLNDREKKILVIVLSLQVVDNIAIIVVAEMAPGSVAFGRWVRAVRGCTAMRYVCVCVLHPGDRSPPVLYPPG